jgi:exopolysaccharide production protein ExoQ
MNPILATLLCAVGIAGLFYLDRDKTVHTSRALWLPIVWIALAGSRSISAWISARAWYVTDSDSSALDVVVFLILLIAAIGVLLQRSRRAQVLLFANWPILLYFFFCLISVTWSYHPDVALKRWIKAIGDLAMVLVLITDAHPMNALNRLTSRLGFLLLPTSLLLIKYFPMIGREYTPDGIQMNTGVSTNKNSLGVLLLVISLSALLRLMTLIRDKGLPDRKRHLLVQSILMGFTLLLFEMAHSATSLACFILGGGLIFAMNLRSFRQRPIRVHSLCLAIVVVAVIAFVFGGQDAVIHALGRNADLSGRTEIWKSVIPAAQNAVIGSGFESFWNSPNVAIFQNNLLGFGWWHPEDLNEAHNGYIEVYLNLGCIGLALIGTILIGGYRLAAKAYRMNPQVGGLFLAYVVVSAVYSITEAGFRMMDPMWIFLIIAVVGSTAVTKRVWETTPRRVLRMNTNTTAIAQSRAGNERHGIPANRTSPSATNFAR